MRNKPLDTQYAYEKIKQLGGQDILTVNDIPDLDAQRGRVFKLMLDGNWHEGPEILQVARGTEGLRRMRELRKMPGVVIEKRRKLIPYDPYYTPRIWEYRLIFDTARGRSF